MATYVQTVDVGQSATLYIREALAREVQRGLTARPRSLSPWMFYDAEGSRLFERIMRSNCLPFSPLFRLPHWNRTRFQKRGVLES